MKYNGMVCHYIVRQLRPWRLLAQSHRSRCIIRTVRTRSGIPTEIGLLDCLTELSLSELELTGAFACGMMVGPAQLLAPPLTVPQRRVAILAFCCRMLRSPGPIPTEIGRMTSLAILEMEHNKLTGVFSITVFPRRCSSDVTK